METNSWIFLAIALAGKTQPADFRGISSIADGINHAIPTHGELQKSVSWLTRKGLIEKQGRKYLLTERGKHFYEQSTADLTGLLDMWKHIEVMFLDGFAY